MVQIPTEIAENQLAPITMSENKKTTWACTTRQTATSKACLNQEMVMSPASGTLMVWVPSDTVYPMSAQWPSLRVLRKALAGATKEQSNCTSPQLSASHVS